MNVQSSNFDPKDLDAFRSFQRESFATLEEVEGQLRAGMTEKQVADMLRRAFAHRGVHAYFHVPVALFGTRTAYPGNFGQFEALPTEQVLEQGMPVILDAAPIFHGHVVDTSLSTTLGRNATHARLFPELAAFRERILGRVRERQSFRAIEREAHSMIRALGAENCHRKHIGAVIGHRVYRTPDYPWNRIALGGLSLAHVGWLLWKSVAAIKGWENDSPNWNHKRTSAHAPFPGLWAVEPHFAVDGVGVKFEEILVITEDDAHWLDDEPPHVKRWNVLRRSA
ncbi:MAG: aminopeptidase P family protein [Spirochaetales bacterium]|nr:aminopeptidase P family protein [Spirochaetales bacterium]MCP5486098.1 aminopeptidase P family protein [Spirochaetales bacterium]